MAQQAVFSVLERIGSIAADEAKYLWGVSDKLESAKKQLLRMQVFLEDLDDKMLKGGAMARNMVSEVREVAFEVEDIIDDANIFRKKSKPKSSFRGAVSKYTCFPRSLTHLHNLGARIDSATASMKALFEDFERLNIAKAALAQESQSYITTDDTTKHWRAVHTDIGEEFDVIGFDEQIEEIKGDLLDTGSRHLTVISIVGPGGAGKTTMAKKVYGSAVVEGHFEAHAWITVSQNVVPHILLKEMVKRLVPRYLLEDVIRYTIAVEDLERFVPRHFLEEVTKRVMGYREAEEDNLAKKHIDIKSDELEVIIKCLIMDCEPKEGIIIDLLEELIKCIMKDQRLNKIKEIEDLQEEQLTKLLRIFTLGKRYLIVLDDIWSTYAWDIVSAAFPDKKNGSRVILTTRNEVVAKYPIARKKMHKPKLLNTEESTQLLLNKALPEHIFNDSGNSTTAMGQNLDELKKLGENLAVKCFGLPLAIVVLGGHLSRHIDVAEWKRLTNSVDWHALIADDRIIGGILDLSFYDMPSNLRSCFIYTTAFPEDSDIDVRELIGLWIAEGFIPLVKGHTREEVAAKYVTDLARRCLILVHRMRYGRITNIKVHDILHDWGNGRAQREGFMKECHVPEDIDVAYSEEMLKAYRVAFHAFKDGLDISPIKKYRTLLYFGPEAKSYQHFGHLRVLYICASSGTAHKVWLPREISRMRYLRCIFLGGTATYELPSSMGDLESLETLHAPNAIINYIPGSLWKIPTLRQVYIPYSKGWSVSQWISSQSKVHAFVGYVTDSTSTGKQVMRAAKHQVLKNKNPSFSFCFGVTYRPLDVHGVAYHHLRDQQTEITGRGREVLQFPNTLEDIIKRWSSSEKQSTPVGVLKICCSNLLNNEQDIRELGWSSGLKVLEIGEQSYTGSVMTCVSGSFSDLKWLVLHDLAVEDWKIERGSMEKLRRLTLCMCPNLTHLPEGLSLLQNLVKVDLIVMPPACYQQDTVVQELKDKGCVVFISSDEKKFQHLNIPIRQTRQDLSAAIE